VKNNTIIYLVRASNSKRDCEYDLYCCLLPQCEALRTCPSGHYTGFFGDLKFVTDLRGTESKNRIRFCPSGQD